MRGVRPTATPASPSDPGRAAAPSAIGKMTSVIEALADNRRVVDICAATSLTSSTVHRILQELVQLGWAREDDDRGYSLGPRVLAIAGRVPQESSVVRAAKGALQLLNDQTGHAVHLGSRLGDEIVYLDKLEGSRSYHMRSRIGVVVPIHTTGIGKAMLAHCDDDEVSALLERTGMSARTEHSIIDTPSFLTELAATRQRGYAEDLEENELHTRCVAAAILNHRGLPVAGISVSALDFDLDRGRMRVLGPLVATAAGTVTAALGGAAPAG